MKKITQNLLLVITISAGFCISCSLFNRPTVKKGEIYPEIVGKKEELANLKTTEKLDPDVKLNGKIAIVRKDAADKYTTLDRFSYDGEFDNDPPTAHKNFLTPEVYAKRPEEIETLIKIECRNDTESATYKGSYGIKSEESFKVLICGVKIIDYKMATVVAKAEFSEGGAPETIYNGQGGIPPTFPGKQIQDYLIGLPSTLLPATFATPTGETFSAHDVLAKIKKSPTSMDQYNGQEITLRGFSYISSHDGSYDYSVTIGDKDRYSLTISCDIDPKDKASFAMLNSGQTYDLTVVGIFEESNSLTSLKQCRLVKAE